jgi:hypothetical protein
MINPAAPQFTLVKMLHEVYRFGAQIQDVCGEVFLILRSLHLQSASLPKVFELP